MIRCPVGLPRLLRHRVRGQVDANGIPVNDYGKKIGLAYNPLTIALHGARYFGLEKVVGPINLSFSQAQNPSWEQILAMADWLLKNEEKSSMCSTWSYDFPWPAYSLAPHWKSALAEIFGAVFFLEMFRTVGDGKYRQAACSHLQSLLTPTSQMGLAIPDEVTGGWWFPEYYGIGRSPPYVLNGVMYVLTGLRHAWSVLGDNKYLQAFELGLIDLKKRIHTFDAGFFTYYDSLGNPANKKYHKIHVSLLDILAASTNDRRLASFRDRWKHMEKGYRLKEPMILLTCLLEQRSLRAIT